MPIIKLSTAGPTDSSLRMSSIGEHSDASSSEAKLERIRDDEHPSPLSEVVDTSADPGTRPVLACASVMAAAEALLEYASGGRTENDCESAQWGSVGQTEAIELGDRGRLQHHGWQVFSTLICVPSVRYQG